VPDPSRTAPAAGAFRSTSRRWVLASCLVIGAITLATIAWLTYDIDAYNRGYAAAAPGTTGTVSSSVTRHKAPDRITVRWWDGNYHEQRFVVGNADAYPVGSPLALRIGRDGRAYPADRSRIEETDDLVTGVVFAAIGFTVAAIAFGWRAVRWGRAARAPARRHLGRVAYSYGKGGLIGSPWLVFDDTARSSTSG